MNSASPKTESHEKIRKSGVGTKQVRLGCPSPFLYLLNCRLLGLFSDANWMHLGLACPYRTNSKLKCRKVILLLAQMFTPPPSIGPFNYSHLVLFSTKCIYLSHFFRSMGFFFKTNFFVAGIILVFLWQPFPKTTPFTSPPCLLILSSCRCWCCHLIK